MSNLKEYVVIKHVKHDSPAIWTKREWDSYKSNPKAKADYIIITTFNADEELKEGEIDKLKAEIVELKKEVFEWKSICHAHNLP